MIRESTIVAAIKKALTAHGCYVVKIHGGAYQTAGIPDLLVIYQGRAYMLEVKRPGALASWRQEVEIKKIRRAGGVAMVVTSASEALEALEAIGCK